MNKTKNINDCVDCPLRKYRIDGPECQHPYFKPKLKDDAYAAMIITETGIPKRCPLKKKPLVINYTITITIKK